MNHLIPSSFGIALLALSAFQVHAANSPAGYVDFGKLAPGSGEFVEVNVTSNLVAMASRLAQKSEPEVSEMLQGLHSIRVNVIGLTEENRSDVETRVKAIRAQLDSQGWERLVTVQQNKEDVGVYIKTRGPDAVEGVVVTVLDGRKQAVLINVVGDINPDKLAMLGDRFNIDPLKKMGHGMKKGKTQKQENAERE